jgi:cytochrome P450
MTLYPHVQKKAQAAIDAVLGGSRLPELADRGSIPYIDALINEVLRWKPVIPLSMCFV